MRHLDREGEGETERERGREGETERERQRGREGERSGVLVVSKEVCPD